MRESKESSTPCQAKSKSCFIFPRVVENERMKNFSGFLILPPLFLSMGLWPFFLRIVISKFSINSGKCFGMPHLWSPAFAGMTGT